MLPTEAVLGAACNTVRYKTYFDQHLLQHPRQLYRLPCTACSAKVVACSRLACKSKNDTPITDALQIALQIYDTATYPNGQTVTGYWPNYNNVDYLYCTDWLKQNLNQAQIQQYGWTATIFNLPCGTCVKIRNRRNQYTTTIRVVDHGGKGFDLDYQRVFRPLDPDGVDWNRGAMDIDYGTVPC